MTTKTYHHDHPRGFANECHIIRCESTEEQALAEGDGYERISRRELARHISWVNRENAAWGSGRAFGHISMDDVVNDPEYRFYTGREYQEIAAERAAREASYA